MSDTLATTYTLAEAIRKIGQVNLILCGEESSDGATGQVPPGLAEWLGINQLTLLTEVNIDQEKRVARGRREIKGGYELLEVPMPCVISVKTACNEPRFMDYKIKDWAMQDEQLTIWDKESFELDEEKIEEFEKEASVVGSNVNIISIETREGVQLKDLGMIAAILRYELKEQ